jgi:hypothetical protein
MKKSTESKDALVVDHTQSETQGDAEAGLIQEVLTHDKTRKKKPILRSTAPLERKSSKCTLLAGIAFMVLAVASVTAGFRLGRSEERTSNESALPGTWIPVGQSLSAEPVDLPTGEYYTTMDLSQDGKTLVVAGLSDDHTAQVKLYRWDENAKAWSHLSTLPLGDQDTDTRPTLSLSGTGGKLAVGDGQTIETAVDSTYTGLVRVYDLTNDTFHVLVQLLDGNLWGSAVDFDYSGDRLAVGAAFAGDTNQGEVSVVKGSAYQSTVGAMRLQGLQAHDAVGRILTLSGNGGTVATGLPLHSTVDTMSGGQVRVWDLSEEDVWTERPGVVGQSGQGLGHQIQLNVDGKILAVASLLTASIQVFRWNGASWWPVGQALEGTRFSMTADGSRLAAVSSGGVRVYAWNGQIWQPMGAALPGVDCVLSETRLVAHTADRLIQSWELAQF